jgi:hypothetical protein
MLHVGMILSISSMWVWSSLFLEQSSQATENTNPCIPSPCSPNFHCRFENNHLVCSCLQNYVGRAPNCRPECTINAECPSNLTCQGEGCKDPCRGTYGPHMTCVAVKNALMCLCLIGYTDDPFAGCSNIPQYERF